jgi:hypothetical protein
LIVLKIVKGRVKVVAHPQKGAFHATGAGGFSLMELLSGDFLEK